MRLVRRLIRRSSEQDRIVPVVDRLNVDDRLLARTAGVVAGPLAERALHEPGVRRSEALDHNLGVGRDRQAGVLSADGLDRLATQAADPLHLVDANTDLEGA